MMRVPTGEARAPGRAGAPPVAALAGLLFCSGFSALVYQTLWLRLLGLVFGVTVHAAGTVLAAFMAGLALGSLAGGRLADRVRAPLRWFGTAELLVGLSALATPPLLRTLETVYRQVHLTVSDDGSMLAAVRFVCSFTVLLVPTTLMGATLPLVLRSSIARASELGTRAAGLYAANTAGALAGAAITGYYLVSQIGIAASFRLAALVNILVGLTAVFWPMRFFSTAVDGAGDAAIGARAPAAAATSEFASQRLRPCLGVGSQATGAPKKGPELPARVRRLVLAVFAVSGFTGLALEIIWFRALVMFLAATTYVFTLILAVVLGGIAFGSAIATRALRHDRDWIARLAVLQIASALAAVASLGAQAWTYSRGWRTSAALQGSALATLPTMILMGAAFPIGLYCWTIGGEAADARAGDRVGRFYLVNLSGSLAGALAAGFLLIPWLGTRGSLIAVASLSLAAGLVLLATLARARPRFATALGGGALVLFAAIASVLPDPLQAVLSRRYPGERVLWREEGAQSTVTVQAAERRVLYLDGLHQANDAPDMLLTHWQIGTLAMVLHLDPRDALVIGLGGGVTASAVARFSDASVDLVELSPSVVRAADWFRHVNGDVLRRPNVRLRIDDGRNYLLLTSKRYDVITADIIQPFHAGAGNLYSVEYFQLAAKALRDDGLMLQWIGHRPEAQYKLIARTFLAAFPHTTVWVNGTLLVGTRQPLRLPLARYRERLADPVFGGALGRAGIAGFGGLVRLYTAGPEEFRRFVGEGPILTDDRPLVEFFLSLPRDDRDISLAGLSGDVNRHIVP